MPDDRPSLSGQVSALPRLLDQLRRAWDDFSLTELVVLAAVAENEGVTVAGLARLCRLTDATASRTIRRLAPSDMPGALRPARGLMMLMRGPTDNRSRYVFLTPLGRETCRSLDQIVADRSLPPLLKPTIDSRAFAALRMPAEG